MDWLPVFFMAVMGFAMFMYVILDGYDLGIGILLPLADDADKDRMIATIGPFWDANETWIVLGIAILLMAFPTAHGMILTSLYIPATIMLIGLMLRGVSFDFRVKARSQRKGLWNSLFFVGSLLAATSQGWMLGFYLMGLEKTQSAYLFSALIAILLPVLYIMLGTGWLMVKAEGELYKKAARWARWFVVPLGFGLLIISIVTLLASPHIASRWISLPEAIGLLPIPLASGISYMVICWVLWSKNILDAGYGHICFYALIVICVMCALGLAYSIFPYVIIGKVDVWQSASARESLMFAFYGTAISVPAIFGYTIFIYRVFSGKTSELSYE